MLRSDLCNYSDAYNLVKVTINVESTNINNVIKELAFKNNDPFMSCISKISNTFIDNEEDLDIVMSLYNLLQCSDNYPVTSEIL